MTVERDIPTRAEAKAILAEALPHNPGPWGDHSRTAARCAEQIARQCGMDPERAYVLALLHDIGRRFGKGHLRHVYDGWQYMLRLGYPGAARVCLTHSFVTQHLDDYVGCCDVTDAERAELEAALAAEVYDDEVRLCILCDCLAGPGYVMDINDRMDDVARRYGSYPADKRAANLMLRALFEQKTGCTLEAILHPEPARTT